MNSFRGIQYLIPSGNSAVTRSSDRIQPLKYILRTLEGDQVHYNTQFWWRRAGICRIGSPAEITIFSTHQHRLDFSIYKARAIQLHLFCWRYLRPAENREINFFTAFKYPWHHASNYDHLLLPCHQLVSFIFIYSHITPWETDSTNNLNEYFYTLTFIIKKRKFLTYKY